MKLLYTERSPFARKARMAALHHGLALELIHCMPTERDPVLMAINPLGKIPVLILENGQSIVDSPVIAEYFDAVGSQSKLLPVNPPERVKIKHLEAVADGILDAAVLCVLETWRPEEKRWPDQFTKQLDNLRGALLYLERHADFFALPLSVAHLSLGAAITYIHGRLPAVGIEEEWLKETPQLAAWYEHFRHNPLMTETAPKEGWM